MYIRDKFTYLRRTVNYQITTGWTRIKPPQQSTIFSYFNLLDNFQFYYIYSVANMYPKL